MLPTPSELLRLLCDSSGGRGSRAGCLARPAVCDHFCSVEMTYPVTAHVLERTVLGMQVEFPFVFSGSGQSC